MRCQMRCALPSLEIQFCRNGAAQVARYLDAFPQFWDVVDDILAVVPMQDPAAPRLVEPDDQNCGDILKATTCDGCPANAGFGVLQGYPTYFAVQQAENIVEAVYELMPDEITIGAATLVCPCKIIVGVIYFALRVGRTVAEAQMEVHRECETNWNRAIININLERD